jgi:hypothetical protein
VAIDDDNFLGRWSRRKHAARRGEALPEPAPEAQPAEALPPTAPAEGAAAAPAETSPAELPPVDSLKGLASEYRDFLRPGVDPATRSAALKKLFGDPHFHFDQMDKLDTYIDDYTKADPIPTAMLKMLSQARGLGLFDEEKEAERPEDTTQSAPAQSAAAPPAIEPPQAAEPTAASPADVPAKTTGA